VKLESLDLFEGVESVHSSPTEDRPTPMSGVSVSGAPDIQTYSAMMRFTVIVAGGESRDMNFALSYDIHFVTAHPCVPSPNTRLLNSPTSPTFEIPDPPPESEHGNHGPHGLFVGHALHKSFSYTRHSLSTVLLSFYSTQPLPLASLQTSSTEVFIIDCNEPAPPESDAMDSHPRSSAYILRKRRFGSDLEMLARAWCAERGYNALISRRGRNCLACSIREARALGWKIILRFG